MDRPTACVEQVLDGADVVLRASGSLMPAWPEEGREIWRMSSAAVDPANERLHNTLENLMKCFDSAESWDAGHTERYVGEYVRGAHVYWGQSDEEPFEQRQRREEFGEALRLHAWGRRELHPNDPLRQAVEAPIVEFISHRGGQIPLEVLPLGPKPLRGAPLWDAVLQLPAFASVVSHLLHGTEDASELPEGRALIRQGSVYEPGGRAFLRSDDAPGWKQMEEHLTGQRSSLAVGPAPDDGLLDSAEKVAEFLICPQDVHSVEPPVSDIHVFAHGRIGAGFEDRFVIPFHYRPSGFRTRTIDFAVRALEIDDALEFAQQRSSTSARPLIWFNCCTAAGPVGRALLGISTSVAQGGCGVIAPRTRIPCVFAVVLASAFYEYLGRHPVPAEALLAARLEKLGGPTHNPLGLLYTGLGRLV